MTYGKNLQDPMEFLSDEEKQSRGFKSILKSPEDKRYIILSVIDDDSTSGVFDVCRGRTACYKRIEELLETYENYDVEKSVVLVECREINMKTREEEYFLNNIDTASSVYSFCKQVEGYYLDDEKVYHIDIEGWRKTSMQDIEEDNTPKSLNGKVSINQKPVGINDEAYNIYMEAMDQNKQ